MMLNKENNLYTYCLLYLTHANKGNNVTQLGVPIYSSVVCKRRSPVVRLEVLVEITVVELWVETFLTAAGWTVTA